VLGDAAQFEHRWPRMKRIAAEYKATYLCSIRQDESQVAFYIGYE
jgi:hypothetical protein